MPTASETREDPARSDALTAFSGEVPQRTALTPPAGGRLLVSELMGGLESYLDPDQVRRVYAAYLFAAEAHSGQWRKSGEPYIYHPIAVASILGEMHLDADTLCAAILHDVIEDTGTSKERVAAEFGGEVAELVDGVSKLTQMTFASQAEAQAENFRKMMLAMVKDIRVILIKLADRLHNMRTLGAMRPDKRRRIARETLEIYAPIAHRLGINSVRLELEDLGFAALYPVRSRVLRSALIASRGHRKEIVGQIETAIRGRLAEEGIPDAVSSREKHLYSLYRKMRDKTGSLGDIMDVYAFRVLVDSVDDCYRVLGVVHNLYKPVPGRFKDYIAIPKSNGYQSLHTVLIGPYGVPIEVQIRTLEMERVAEAGIAAHWRYKTGDEGANSAHRRAREWLRALIEMQRQAGDSREFLENVKVDLFPDEVYVFTPKGDITVLPRGATVVDFAYNVHTEVGNACIAAKINRQLAPLRMPLLNGQTVEIITAQGARPNPAWLNFVVTGKARTAIRHYLKNQREEEAVALGRRLLERALLALGGDLDAVQPGHIEATLAEYRLDGFEALLAEIGIGDRLAALVARRLLDRGNDTETGEHHTPLAIRGTEGAVVSYARCCRPIPGDPIVGFLSAGRGVVIHHSGCKNIAEYRHRPEKWIEVEWAADPGREFLTELRLEVENRRGVLATVAATVADTDSNIENVSMEERDGSVTTMVITLAVRDRQHLADMMRALRRIRTVLRISRGKG